MRGRTPALVLAACLLAVSCGGDAGDGDDAARTVDDDGSAPVDTQVGSETGAGDVGRAVRVDPATDPPEPLDVEIAPFLPTVCPFDVEVELTVECGVVEVPESRTGLSDATVEIAVAILRTPSSRAEPDPVVFLAGGPGGVALAEHFIWSSGVDDWEEHPVLATRDLVLVDQRGTGYSRPSLWCDHGRESVGGCHDRLVAAGIMLAAYSTPENAADIATVRLSLGLDEWNLYGSSYGSRLALTVLRDHPEGIRSVVLEGVYPPQVVPAYHDYLPNTVRALDALAEACAADDGCATTHGDVAELLDAALAAVDAAPRTPVDPAGLLDLVLDGLYDMETVLDLPYALALAADGDLDAAVELLDTGASPPGLPGPSGRNRHGRWEVDPTQDSVGVFTSIECREEHAFTDLAHVGVQADMYRAAGVNERIVEALVATVEHHVVDICPRWDSGAAAFAERAPTVSTTPVLLLSGRFDPITPAAWGEIAAASLANSTHVVAPNLSHSLVLEDPCIDAITAGFLADPSAAVDTRCVATMRMPRFTVE